MGGRGRLPKANSGWGKLVLCQPGQVQRPWRSEGLLCATEQPWLQSASSKCSTRVLKKGRQGAEEEDSFRSTAEALKATPAEKCIARVDPSCPLSCNPGTQVKDVVPSQSQCLFLLGTRTLRPAPHCLGSGQVVLGSQESCVLLRPQRSGRTIAHQIQAGQADPGSVCSSRPQGKP